ncbi:hypothetical protein ABZ532_06420 [Streptomyces sp. NPDC019396]|uniref:hypothetical protein n=1 Tax=Streptomyces sp. NPDC019396 TaxID=3154687 RepID=UPI0033C967FB
MAALALKRLDRLLRTSTAACAPSPSDDLIAQTCAATLVATVFVLAQCHLLELEVIGFVLP